MNKKGFTLIELLAVITIMGVLMIIAIPAITKTIQNAREDTAINSVKTFVKEVDKEIISEYNAGNVINDGIYPIMDDGNICMDEAIADANDCDDGNIFVVEIEGQKVSGGKVEIENNKVKKIYNIEIIKKYVNEDNKNKYYITNDMVDIVQKLCKALNGSVSLNIGTAYNCEVSSGVYQKFYVLGSSGSKVSLILDRNFSGAVAWHDYNGRINLNTCGPTTAYEKLYLETSGWDKVPNIAMNYTDPGNSDIRINTTGTSTRIYSRNPDCDMHDISFENLKARLPYKNELNSSYTWLGENMEGLYDYWANEAITNSTYAAHTFGTGMEVLGQYMVGVRPVIEVSTDDLG